MKRLEHPDQIELDFDRQIELYAEYGQSILEQAHKKLDCEAATDGRETEAEFYIGLAAACKVAIEDSGLSRVEVIGKISSYFGRCGEADPADMASDPPPTRPVSIYMFNNYLSKPTSSRLPMWIVYGICRVTGHLAPLEYLARGLGATMISATERTELVLGKLDAHIREGVALKKQIQRSMGARRG